MNDLIDFADIGPIPEPTIWTKPPLDLAALEAKIAEYPKDGRAFTLLVPVQYRWKKYKPDGQRQMKAAGRWQKATSNGDWFSWENCEPPADGLQQITPDDFGQVSR